MRPMAVRVDKNGGKQVWFTWVKTDDVPLQMLTSKSCSAAALLTNTLWKDEPDAVFMRVVDDASMNHVITNIPPSEDVAWTRLK